MILFFDTETTGLPDFPKPSHFKTQPDIVQLTALLVEDDGTKRGSIDMLIRPECNQDDWNMEQEALDTHGLTYQVLDHFGVPMTVALDTFFALLEAAPLSVAFNRYFDYRMIRIALKKRNQRDPRLELWEGHSTSDGLKPLRDPMFKAKKAMPKGGRYRLLDCYQHFLGREMEGAHNSAKDVLALMELWFELRQRGILS